MRSESPPSAHIAVCPGCGAHLKDTWTGDDCGRCGFQYIYEATPDASPSTASRTQSPSLRRTLTGHVLGVLGAMLVIISSAYQPSPDAIASERGQSIILHADAMAAMVPAGLGLALGVILLLFAGQHWGGGRHA